MSADWHDHIVLDPDVLAGKPIVKNTRLSVEYILDMIAAGVGDAEILANHPRLSAEALRACIAYAAELVRSERVYKLGA